MNKRLELYFERLRKDVQKDSTAWIAVADDLANIKAYYEEHEDEICEEEGVTPDHYGWIQHTQRYEPTLAGYDRSWFRQTLSALDVHETVTVGDVSPTVKRHCQVLASVPAKKRNQVWKKALKAAGDKPVVFSHVVEARRALLPPPPTDVVDEPGDINDETRRAMGKILQDLDPIKAATDHADHLSVANRKWLRGQVSNAIAILTAFDGALEDADSVLEPGKKLLS